MGRIKKKKLFKKGRKKLYTKKELTRQIVKIFQENLGQEFNYKQLSSQLGIRDMPTKQMISVVLWELEDLSIIAEERRGRYKLVSTAGYIQGVIRVTGKGTGYVSTDELDEDVFISAKNMKKALPGDTVRVSVYAKRKKKELEGEVVTVIERAKTTFVGTLQLSKHFAFFIPSQKMNHDIFIPKENLNGMKDGQKGIVRITDWPEKARNPFGEVIEVLGDAGSNEAEMHAILAEFELPYKFPEKVNKAAERLDATITEEEIARRKDFRNVTTFTIDPVDAKDFDDALSIRKLENGNTEVGVHIADVTHYVKPNTILENEAFDRATSVYLVDRVVPMLPERLSNGVCSLRPHEEKLCYSAVFELDENAMIRKEWFGRTVIYSDRRFSYEEAQEIIEGAEGDYKHEILTLDALAKQLRERRFDNGSIGFERVEVRFNIDEGGKPLGVYFKESKDANKLIEEFMLLANKRVAEFIGKREDTKKPKTFVYRIHDKPDPERLHNFNTFIHKFGYGIQTGTDKQIAQSMNKLLKNVEGAKEQNVVETLAIRTMAKAEYSTKNIGHYGLHFAHYSHFTSPIRRYPDMMVHRLLDRYLDGGRSANEQKWEEMCKHSSQMEQRAANAERASIKYKQVEFMSDKIGQKFPGVISGVTEWGLYVELNDSKCEGMVPLRSLIDDFYVFDEKNYCIIGERSNNKYQLGDAVTVKVGRCDLEKKQLDFELLS